MSKEEAYSKAEQVTHDYLSRARKVPLKNAIADALYENAQNHTIPHIRLDPAKVRLAAKRFYPDADVSYHQWLVEERRLAFEYGARSVEQAILNESEEK